MKQIIEDVFQAEQKVDKILNDAREKASQIKMSADKQGTDKVNEAKKKAQEIIQTSIENAKREAENLRIEKLKQAEVEKENLLNKKDIIDKIVDEICNVVLETDYDINQ